uniref:alpha-1,6-mannosyl-glycoprotein 6-beta-N-acetylglucosaminyltransferase n=1 Tax=Knipowitschia caucasica TaxID=637954 RepID=A0AAV2KJG4_KNICA
MTGPLPFELIYTDYHGLKQIKKHMSQTLKRHKCHIRVIDTFGTEPAYNHEEYATQHGYRTNWGYWNLNARQYMTMFPHTADNSFMGFVVEEVNETERLSIQKNKIHNMAVVYGKDASMWQLEGKDRFLELLHHHMEIHGTVYYDSQRPPQVPAFVKNHGLLPQNELQQLLRKAKLFIGFGFPYEGPAPLEAIANGCIFLQPMFHPPHSSLNHDFFKGKPTSREVTSQHPYAEQYIGRPHVITIDFGNSTTFNETIREIMELNVEPYVPHEYTCEGMLERVHAYIQNQDIYNSPHQAVRFTETSLKQHSVCCVGVIANRRSVKELLSNSSSSDEFTVQAMGAGGARPKTGARSRGRGGRRTTRPRDLTSDDQRRLQALQNRRMAELQEKIKSLRLEQRDILLQRVVQRTPGMLFDILSLLENPHPTRPITAIILSLYTIVIG